MRFNSPFIGLQWNFHENVKSTLLKALYGVQLKAESLQRGDPNAKVCLDVPAHIYLRALQKNTTKTGSSLAGVIITVQNPQKLHSLLDSGETTLDLIRPTVVFHQNPHASFPNNKDHTREKTSYIPGGEQGVASGLAPGIIQSFLL